MYIRLSILLGAQIDNQSRKITDIITLSRAYYLNLLLTVDDDVSAKHHQQLLEYRTYTRNKQANRFDLATQTYMTTFLCSLKNDAFRMNKLMLSTLPESDSESSIFHAIDCEDGKVLEHGEGYDDSADLRTFKKGTNFPRTVSCIIGAKVMFLTNSMIDQGISNGTCGVILSLRPNGEPNVAFPTKYGIRVRQLILS